MHSPFTFERVTRDVLAALNAAEEACDAPTVARAAGRHASSVYPVLAGLEECGWVDSQWDSASPDGTGRRRVYQITPTGQVGTAQLAAKWEAERRSRLAHRPRPVLAALKAVSRLRWGAS